MCWRKVEAVWISKGIYARNVERWSRQPPSITSIFSFLSSKINECLLLPSNLFVLEWHAWMSGELWRVLVMRTLWVQSGLLTFRKWRCTFWLRNELDKKSYMKNLCGEFAHVCCCDGVKPFASSCLKLQYYPHRWSGVRFPRWPPSELNNTSILKNPCTQDAWKCCCLDVTPFARHFLPSLPLFQIRDFSDITKSKILHHWAFCKHL